MSTPAAVPLVAPLFERGPATRPLRVTGRGRHRTPARGWRRQLGRALVVLALAAPRLTSPRT